MQQSTLFSMLLILLNKRRVSRDYLAERFSVSKRTVTRYLAVLTDAGVPVSYATGKGGGVWLSDDFILDKSYFTEAETRRLRDVLARTSDAYDDNVNTVIAEKLESASTAREHDKYVINQQNLYIDCEYGQASSVRTKIKLLSEATDQTRAVDIKYTDAHGYVSFRSIEPYTLVFKEGTWYVYAMCKLRGDFRLFKLSRISDLRKTSKRFVKYESRLTEKLELEYYNELYADIEFEFFPALRDSVTEWLGMDAITERGTKLVATAEVPVTDALFKKLLSYGSSIKLLKPSELVDQLKEEAARMTEMYKSR